MLPPMRTLLHAPFDPFCRKIRLVLAEKKLDFTLEETAPWEGGPDLARRNPALTVPVLIDTPPSGGEASISPSTAITEYLAEVYGAPPVLPATSAARAEARRIAAWFDEKFEREVNAFTIREKIDKRLKRRGPPDDMRLRQGVAALIWHLDYVNYLAETRDWLAGELSIADFAAAAHLSVLDYFGAAPWRDFPYAKDWYARMKSRPSFRPLLEDRLPGTPPPRAYADLDF